MIYLNHAATSWPKPEKVIQGYLDGLRALPEGQFRSVRTNSNVMDECRQSLGELFQIQSWRRIFFTSGATEAANNIINGLRYMEKRVLVTQVEYHSVLRPLYNHPAALQVMVLPCDEHGHINPQSILNVPGKYDALFVNHCSNVTGAVQDMCAIGRTAKARGIPLIMDAAQSAGCIPIRAEDWYLSGLVFTGHKSLQGLPGTGGFYIREDLPIIPCKFGGTGRDGRVLRYGDKYEFEPGTQNAPAIGALNIAVKALLETGVVNVQAQEIKRIAQVKKSLSLIPRVHVFGGGDNQGPVISITMDGLKPGDLAYILESSYGVITRDGLHCAPLIHERLGTKEKGTLRISISKETTQKELDTFIEAIKEISHEVT